MGSLRKTLVIALLLTAALSFFTSASAAGKTLKAVCFLPKTHNLAVMSVEWVKRVNKAFEGELEVKYIGGPEITASKQQIQALQNGVFDINFNVTSYYSPLAPELNAFQLSKLMPWEERKQVFYDFMQKRHEKIGVTYLGRWLYGPFYLWTKERVSGLEDLEGLKLRTGPMYIYFMNKLGVSSVSIKPTDVYTALERGTADGFAWPLLGARELGWTDSCKYLIDHGFYMMDGTIIFNRDTWEGLTEATRIKLEKLTADFERDMVAYFESEMQAERERLEKEGVEFIRFPEAEAEAYLDKAYSAYWEHLENKVPDLVPRLKEITTE
ncbi:MAG: TRAP transporter substrate-binding protein DctP [Deltaproteobacteria bacterium]|nr:TRAP transporter substrate-binding protein DctP [Deltaproteobacteria bacterium]